MAYIIYIVLFIAIILLYLEVRILGNKVSILQDMVVKTTTPYTAPQTNTVSEEDLKLFREEDAKATEAFLNMTAELNAFMTGREDISHAEQQE